MCVTGGEWTILCVCVDGVCLYHTNNKSSATSHAGGGGGIGDTKFQCFGGQSI